MREPRDWLKARSQFGRDLQARWRDGDDVKAPAARLALRAAQIQHDIAFIVRDEMRARKMPTYEAICKETGVEMKARYLGEIIRGERPISLRHIAALETKFGPLLVSGAAARRLIEIDAAMRAATQPPAGKRLPGRR